MPLAREMSAQLMKHCVDNSYRMAIDGAGNEREAQLTLGAFLRAAREALHPEDVGLVPRRRSRTPGLRREDVAELAGISETYYAWLEQGRVARPTARVLKQIARALRLSETDERRLIAQALGFDPSAESFAIIAAERFSAFLDEFARTGWRARTLSHLGRVLVDGIHHPGQLTFFKRIDGDIGTFIECRGPGADRLLGSPHALEELGVYLPVLIRGDVVSIANMGASENGLARERVRTVGIRSVIEVAIFSTGKPVAMFGYAETRPRDHSEIERHLLSALARFAERTVAHETTVRTCDLRRSIVPADAGRARHRASRQSNSRRTRSITL